MKGTNELTIEQKDSLIQLFPSYIYIVILKKNGCNSADVKTAIDGHFLTFKQEFKMINFRNRGIIHRAPGHHVTKFCTVGPNICCSSAWKLLHVTLPAPRILRWLLDFFENLCNFGNLLKPSGNFTYDQVSH
jgi:hypothetical protein